MSGESMRVAISGAAGRMGRTLVAACAEREGVECAGALEHPGHDAIGVDAGVLAGSGAIGVEVTDDPERFLGAVDGVIDFSVPASTLALVERCRAAGRQIVIGTTGFSAAERALVARCAQDIAVLHAPNMSVGVNVCFRLIEIASRALGEDSDIEVIEMHHRNKIDAPSGTAVRMGEIVAETLGRDLSKCAVYGREGFTGVRDRETIGFETIRGGDAVGEHTVMFAGTGERIEITHRSASRFNFAHGALRASLWLQGREPGLYDMQDVLGLR
ncbi:MAG: 4-hydroxy-tetrahydrodipicolinate reductase [Immundisolibacterales bacterium]|nr:4-hydroxy-tetrahydrodipicolinate reductase [Immundisolibacterales bacterium]